MSERIDVQSKSFFNSNTYLKFRSNGIVDDPCSKSGIIAQFREPEMRLEEKKLLEISS